MYCKLDPGFPFTNIDELNQHQYEGTDKKLHRYKALDFINALISVAVSLTAAEINAWMGNYIPQKTMI